mmetsp:Transcript_9666/g.17401  ORF Transcript_9666/g.17401 Transcript_9666/m.17401 type:complete len:363 (-) Transcript_9666:259-1347(-)|eukprot:CAMPEP_0177753964 /NCGR_PEP_ID=MMETSP0491_2-20121128/1752_1 /TAXON_ID=63592 /ORGANISM="Tetraselmis chuii, Strain PLY429" /LENGTH=362 /DNA_ID=CAMNT_0019269307 /DNA_START=110 /DNA_END=1198 /DNA_ORIENTATION=+
MAASVRRPPALSRSPVASLSSGRGRASSCARATPQPARIFQQDTFRPRSPPSSAGVARWRWPSAPRHSRAVVAMARPRSQTSEKEMERFVDIANRLADAAAEVTVPLFRTRVAVEVKADASPVTIADKRAEEAMRAILSTEVPQHSVFGEEAGISRGSDGDGKYCWVIDPIDGTKSFITGKPLFGTLIALLRDGEPVLGIIDQPVLKERWLGVEGRPSTLNGEKISTRKCGNIGSAYMYCTTPHMFSGDSETSFNRVRDRVRIPMYGCDCYAYGLLAAGHCDLVVEADLKPYDYMALVPVIKGAGGQITDWRGAELRLDIDMETGVAEPYPTMVVAAGDKFTLVAALEALEWERGPAEFVEA